ncbi:hypothetical protein SK128_007177 [Halocaridina rubra]|uniref:Uncharacterized protein n=1 Tax=Halocaridina rubra TaxID=373956 RepID=A0AAN8WRL1_HALRR
MGGKLATVKQRARWPFQEKSKSIENWSLENWATQVMTPIGEYEINTRMQEKILASELGLDEPKTVWRPSLPKELEISGTVAPIKQKHDQLVENIVQKELWPLRLYLRSLGLIPYTYNKAHEAYRLRWRSLWGIHTLLTALYLTVLVITAIVSIIHLIKGREMPAENINQRAIKLTGMILLSEILFNAWAQFLNVISVSRKICIHLNAWNNLAAASELDLVKSLKKQVIIQILFLSAICISILVMTALEYPKIVLLILDGVAEGMLMIPEVWINASTSQAMSTAYEIERRNQMLSWKVSRYNKYKL